MTTNVTTKFNFRTKFKKLLNDENYSIVETGFNKFCSLEPKEALDILWHFTYISDVYHIGMSQLGLPSELLTEENLYLTRNELRYQYENLNPNFLNVDIPEECLEQFKELVKKADIITAKVIFEHCKHYFHMREADMSRALYLLKSDKENLYFGGIRCFDFNMDEADYLKLYHMEIHDMLATIYAFINSEETQIKEKEEDFLITQEDQEEIQTLAEVVEEREEVKVSTEYKAITPEEILLHKEVFKSFVEKEDLNLLIPIGKFGFDLNEVMMKKDKIFEFIIAAEDLIT